ncbi:hypothetical protein GF337_08235 [candidate division KSB1 bacterium]|nr:hypothetical protein [candidate division KSB1 bacterium]
MRRFAQLLIRINEKLDLPQPQKSKILLEIAADMDELFNIYLKRGESEADAMVKIEEKFSMDDETINELIALHDSGFRKFLDRLSMQAQTRWERLVLLVSFLMISFACMRAATTTDFLSTASKFIYPIMAIGSISGVLAIRKFYHLYLKKEHELRTLRKGLIPFLVLAGLSLFTAIFGYFVELALTEDKFLWYGQYLFFTITPRVFDVYGGIIYFIQWMMKTSAMIITGIFVAIVSAMFWHIFQNKVSKIEVAETSILLKN